ncbi:MULTISPECIES: PadR family transcriptional regulator [Nocardia]|uniref:PadR family transcriptional regulator n=1 Tax=Nocardia TaxID=1817 RepID=UPI00135B6575|nr:MULTISPECIES: PadR family transcriptional regulator [Nocardia]
MGQGQEHSTVTPLGIAVLALLEERPMHPYEMFQTLIARREDKLVKVRPGSLYHTVSRLADQELVRAEGVDRAGNRPERTTYRITGRGEDALRNRIAEIVRRPVPEYPIFPVALGELHNLPKPEAMALLRERIGVLEIELADTDMLSAWAEEHAVPRRYWIALPYLRAMLAAELAWVVQFTGELDSGALEWEDFAPATGARSDDGDTGSVAGSTASRAVPGGAEANSVQSFSNNPS